MPSTIVVSESSSGRLTPCHSVSSSSWAPAGYASPARPRISVNHGPAKPATIEAAARTTGGTTNQGERRMMSHGGTSALVANAPQTNRAV